MEGLSRKARRTKRVRCSVRTRIETVMRRRVRETIEAIVEEELEAALGAAELGAGRRRAARVSARDAGADADDEPGADDDRDAAGASPARRRGDAEWRSETVRAISAGPCASTKRSSASIWAGRTRGGSKARWRRCCVAARCRRTRCRGSWAGLREDFETWRTRDLADEDIRYLFMDGWYPEGPHRQAARARAGARDAGRARQRRARGARHAAGRRRERRRWGEVIASLVARHLARPVLAVIDGNPGLAARAASALAGLAIQRCTAHKLRNLAGQGAGAAARGARRGLPPDDLRRDGDRRRAGAHPIHEEVAAALSGGGREPGRGRRRALHLSALSRRRSGRRCGRRTRSSASTRSSAAAPRRKPACPAKTPCSCCSLVCCAAVR